MCQFIETIQILDGEVCRLEYHQRRMDATRVHFFGEKVPIDLGKLIVAPKITSEIKCRIVYAKDIIDISYAPYTLRHIGSLRLVTDNEIEYAYKSTDRDRLSKLAAMKGTDDEVLIVKNGLVTDTSFTNIALYDGKKWQTPAHPLLEGTQRASLIDKGLLHEKDIHIEDLYKFQKLCLINAMIDFGKIIIPTSNIH